MAAPEAKNFDSADEKRDFTNGHLDLLHLAGSTVGRISLEPGWRWSNDIKPIVGGDNCQANHLGFVISGRLAGKMEDGTEMEIGPGDAYRIPPGHDAWVVGDEPYVALEFAHEAAEKYAKPS